MFSPSVALRPKGVLLVSECFKRFISERSELFINELKTIPDVLQFLNDRSRRELSIKKNNVENGHHQFEIRSIRVAGIS